jgi:hypothetical protein
MSCCSVASGKAASPVVGVLPLTYINIKIIYTKELQFQDESEKCFFYSAILVKRSRSVWLLIVVIEEGTLI